MLLDSVLKHYRPLSLCCFISATKLLRQLQRQKNPPEAGFSIHYQILVIIVSSRQ